LAEGLDELHVDLQLVAWALLLVALPPRLTAFVALGSRQAAHASLVQDAPDAGWADLDLVVALQVHRDLVRAEVVALPQPQDLLDDLGLGGLG
jgi:hypothetical protein